MVGGARGGAARYVREKQDPGHWLETLGNSQNQENSSQAGESGLLDVSSHFRSVHAAERPRWSSSSPQVSVDQIGRAHV